MSEAISFQSNLVETIRHRCRRCLRACMVAVFSRNCSILDNVRQIETCSLGGAGLMTTCVGVIADTEPVEYEQLKEGSQK